MLCAVSLHHLMFTTWATEHFHLISCQNHFSAGSFWSLPVQWVWWHFHCPAFCLTLTPLIHSFVAPAFFILVLKSHYLPCFQCFFCSITSDFRGLGDYRASADLDHAKKKIYLLNQLLKQENNQSTCKCTVFMLDIFLLYWRYNKLWRLLSCLCWMSHLNSSL